MRLPDGLGPAGVSGCSGGEWQKELCLTSLWGGLISPEVPSQRWLALQTKGGILQEELKVFPHPPTQSPTTRLTCLQITPPLCTIFLTPFAAANTSCLPPFCPKHFTGLLPLCSLDSKVGQTLLRCKFGPPLPYKQGQASSLPGPRSPLNGRCGATSKHIRPQAPFLQQILGNVPLYYPEMKFMDHITHLHT